MDPRELENGEHLARYMQGLEEDEEGIYGVMEDIRAAAVRDALRKAMAEKNRLQDENQKLQEDKKKLQDDNKKLREDKKRLKNGMKKLKGKLQDVKEEAQGR